MNNEIKLTLPWPPSVNHYWRHCRGRFFISKAGKNYRAAVVGMLSGCTRMDGRLSVLIKAFPPDRRKRDLDNLIKATFDALAHGGLYNDDCQIDDFRIIRMPVSAPGRLELWIMDV